jgi:hypothetical protein
MSIVRSGPARSANRGAGADGAVRPWICRRVRTGDAWRFAQGASDNRVVIPTELRRLPKSAVTTGLDLIDGEGKRVRRARSVLVLGEIAPSTSRRLKDRGAELTWAQTVTGALEILASRTFDAAIVDTWVRNATAMVKRIKLPVRLAREEIARLVKERAGNILVQEEREAVARFVEDVSAAVKGFTPEELKQLAHYLDRPDTSPEALATRRHALTPFFMLHAGDESYAIVVRPPEHSYLEDGHGISLPDAVMMLDVGKLLLRGSALA